MAAMHACIALQWGITECTHLCGTSQHINIINTRTGMSYPGTDRDVMNFCSKHNKQRW